MKKMKRGRQNKKEKDRKEDIIRIKEEGRERQSRKETESESQKKKSKKKEGRVKRNEKKEGGLKKE